MINPYFVIAGLAALIIAFGGGSVFGYRYADGQHAKADLAAQQQRQEFIDLQRSHEAKVSETLEAKLAELSANEKVIEREKIKIVERPVYRNQCLDSDGVRLIEAARVGTAGDSSKPANPLP